MNTRRVRPITAIRLRHIATDAALGEKARAASTRQYAARAAELRQIIDEHQGEISVIGCVVFTAACFSMFVDGKGSA